jgi:hypothetical protein
LVFLITVSRRSEGNPISQDHYAASGGETGTAQKAERSIQSGRSQKMADAYRPMAYWVIEARGRYASTCPASNFSNMSLSIRCLANHEQDGKDLDLTQNKPDKTEAVTSEGSHHATGLVQEHSRWLDRTHLEKPNEDLTTRVGRLNDLIRNWTQRLNAQDLRKTIPVLGMRSLLDQLSQVLFGSQYHFPSNQARNHFRLAKRERTKCPCGNNR